MALSDFFWPPLVKYARTYLHMQPTNKHNQALYFLLVASMSFLGGNTFLRKSNCKLATCRPEYHAISSSCLFKVPVLHLNIALHTFHYAHYNYCCTTDWRLCYDQWDAGWLYPVFPRHGNKCPCHAGVGLYFNVRFSSIFFFFIKQDSSKSLIGNGILVWHVYIVWRKDNCVIVLLVSDICPSLLLNYRSWFYW